MGAAASPDDSRSGTGGVGASLAPMATATQLERDGLGRRVGLAAMLLSEPFATKLMYRHASAGATEACRAREMLPRDHPTFAPLLQLLELGDAARAMFRAESFGVRAVEEALTRAVLPCVVALHTRVHHVLLAAAAEAAAAAAVSRGSAEALGADSSNKDVKEKAEKEAAAAVAAAADASEAADLALSLGIADGDGGCVHEDWRKWYKNFPAVRRVTCTMLCRALAVGVRGGAGTSGKGTGSGKAGERASQAAALLMPAARPAAKRMADERWLWATLAEVVQKNKALTGAGVGKNAAREAPSAGGLKPEVERCRGPWFEVSFLFLSPIFCR